MDSSMFMPQEATTPGRLWQLPVVGDRDYAAPMAFEDSRKVLRDNVFALMEARYGKENLTQFAIDTKCGPGTSTRIKNARTWLKLDTLEKIARAFGLQPWQLLVPNLDASNPPVVWLTENERLLYKRLKLAAQEVAAYDKN